MEDIRAHVEVSSNFPACPSQMHLYIRSQPKVRPRFMVEKDGSLTGVESATTEGTWWCHSAQCVEIKTGEIHEFLKYDDGSVWTNSRGSVWIIWNRKRGPLAMENDKLTPCKSRKNNQNLLSTPNMSRFRMSMLPVDILDKRHSAQLECMGLRICYHGDIGRVLVSSRRFEDGEVMVYSQVATHDVDTDDQVLSIVDPSHPSCCYLLVPRTKKLYYNAGKFSHDDPVASGDLWYLVNHSPRPNVDVVLRKRGIQFKAKRVIQPNEPITWTYPHGFFGADEVAEDLPQNIVPDDGIENRPPN